jgi:signal transduction histidine kinase
VFKFQANPEIQANSTELNQVYNYVIENSCHAIIEKQRTKEKKSKETITIKTKEEKKHLVISIQDTGSGMSRKIRKQVFDPFFTTKPVGEGKGLGLFFSYIIINKHQGRIKIESEEGSGTTVTLYLPLKRKEISIKKKVKINLKRRDKK